MVWRNWGRTVRARPATVASPRCGEDVVRAVEMARRRGLRVRSVGSGHSFSPVASTDGVLMQMTGLSGLESVDLDTQVAWFSAGTLVSAAAGQLAGVGLAFENIGDVDHQTIAGAIATGTHGTGMGFAGMAAQVVGLRMVL